MAASFSKVLKNFVPNVSQGWSSVLSHGHAAEGSKHPLLLEHGASVEK